MASKPGEELNIRDEFIQNCLIGNASLVEEKIREDPEVVRYSYDSLEGAKALHIACQYAFPDVVRLLLKSGADVAAEDDNKCTPMHYVAKEKKNSESENDEVEEKEARASPTTLIYVDAGRNSSKEVIEVLCSYKGDVNALDKTGCTPLHYAATSKNAEAAKYFLARGADPNIANANSITPLLLAAANDSFEVFSVLFDKSLKLTRDRRRNSALHIATQHGNLDMIRRILNWMNNGIEDEKPAETNTNEKSKLGLLRYENSEGKTALCMAVEIDNKEIVKELLKHYKNRQFSDNEELLVHLAARNGYLEMAKILIEEAGLTACGKDGNGCTPLHEAARENQTKMAKYLLEVDQSTLNTRNKAGFTPLLSAAEKDAIGVVKVLLDHKADVLLRDKAKKNILFVAAEHKSAKVLKFILGYLESPPADSTAARQKNVKKTMINEVDAFKNTAFHCACRNGHIETAKLLHKQGAKADSINVLEQTPMHSAAENGHLKVVKQLLKWNKKLSMTKDKMGCTPLHYAALNGHEEVTRLLGSSGSDLKAKDLADDTPLYNAVRRGQLEATKALIELGAKPMPEVDNGIATPLHIAAREGHEAVVRYLISLEVEVHRKDENGMNPLDIAIENGHKEIALLLVQHKDWLQLVTPHGNIELPGLMEPRDTPMRRLIHKFPDVARVVFDNCITSKTDGEKQINRHFYELLDDTWLRLAENKKSLSCEASAYGETGNLLPDTLPYSPSYQLIYENHPLRVMVKSKRLPLLSHPLVISLLMNKWNNLGRYFYYSAVVVYMIFVAFFTLFIALAPAPFNLFDKNSNQFVDYEDVMQNRSMCARFAQELSHQTLLAVCRYVVIILAILQLFKEIFQLYHRKLSYFTYESLFEIFVYTSAIFVVYDFNECSEMTGIREEWQWNLAAASSFLQWINLLLLIRKLPRFGIFIIMFMTILRTFARFFIIFLLFILAFSISFFIILQNRPEFETLPTTIMKTTVMMIGEFDFTSIFHGNEDEHSEKIFVAQLAHPLFLIFSVVMTILLMNLLVGLAVDNIKAVQEKAELERLSLQVNLVLDVECTITNYIRRKYAKGSRTFDAVRKSWWQRLRSCWRSKGGKVIPLVEKIEEDEDPVKEFLIVLKKQQKSIEEIHLKLLLVEKRLGRMFEEQDAKEKEKEEEEENEEEARNDSRRRSI